MAPVPPFLGPGFWLGARWNRLGEAVKTRKKRGKTGKKWARYYGLKRMNKERKGGITWEGDVFHVHRGWPDPWIIFYNEKWNMNHEM